MRTYHACESPLEPHEAPHIREETKISVAKSSMLYRCAALVGSSALLFATYSLVQGNTQFSFQSMVSEGSTSLDEQCIDTDSAVIYKYTIASSTPTEDGVWADKLMGCTFRNVTQSADGCSVKLGKTSCMETTLGFGLHFVWNTNAKGGDKDVDDWDSYFQDLHERSFANNKYNQFMDYSLTLYAPDISATIDYIINKSGDNFLARYQIINNVTWYSFYVAAPSGKVFELVSTNLKQEILDSITIQSWKSHSDSECPKSHEYTRYSVKELDDWYEALNPDATTTVWDLPMLMPIRTNIAVPTELHASVLEWYSNFMPAISANFESITESQCKISTSYLGYETNPTFNHDIRFISNPNAGYGEYDVRDFVRYIRDVEKNYTGVDYGWTSWYDRHLGVQLQGCPLDDYMKKFAEHNVSFHPHGRDSTNSAGEMTDHCWTQGTAAYGLEMQGNFSYEYRSCYTDFDWCTWDTDPAVVSGSSETCG